MWFVCLLRRRNEVSLCMRFMSYCGYGFLGSVEYRDYEEKVGKSLSNIWISVTSYYVAWSTCMRALVSLSCHQLFFLFTHDKTSQADLPFTFTEWLSDVCTRFPRNFIRRQSELKICSFKYISHYILLIVSRPAAKTWPCIAPAPSPHYCLMRAGTSL